MQSIKAGAQVTPFFLIPNKGRTVVAKVVGERRHVVRSVGEAENVFADDVTGRFVAKTASVVGDREDRKLLHNEPVEMLSLNFLSRYEVEGKRIKACDQEPCAFPIGIHPVVVRHQERQCVPDP